MFCLNNNTHVRLFLLQCDELYENINHLLEYSPYILETLQSNYTCDLNKLRSELNAQLVLNSKRFYNKI